MSHSRPKTASSCRVGTMRRSVSKQSIPRPLSASRHCASTPLLRPQSAVPQVHVSKNPRDEYEREARFLTKGSGLKRRTPTGNVNGESELNLTPERIDFGRVLLGSKPEVKTLSLTNLGIGTKRFRLGSIESRIITVSFQQQSTKIAAGMGCKIDIILTPSKPDIVQEDLTIQVDGKVWFKIPLSAHVVKEMGDQPDEKPGDKALALLKHVPRLARSFFDWQKEELFIYKPMHYKMDETWSLDRIRQWDIEQELYDLSVQPPPFCERVWDAQRETTESSKDCEPGEKQIVAYRPTTPARSSTSLSSFADFESRPELDPGIQKVLDTLAVMTTCT